MDSLTHYISIPKMYTFIYITVTVKKLRRYLFFTFLWVRAVDIKRVHVLNG